jgi:hypothetical protein
MKMTKRRYRGLLCAKHPQWRGLRYRCNRRCVECQRLAAERWFEQNRERKNAADNAWRRAHLAYAAASMRRWRAKARKRAFAAQNVR